MSESGFDSSPSYVTNSDVHVLQIMSDCHCTDPVCTFDTPGSSFRYCFVPMLDKSDDAGDCLCAESSYFTLRYTTILAHSSAT